MHLVSLHSQKGGTGKTSIALSLAIAAERRNLKTLLVDADLSGTSIRNSIHLTSFEPSAEQSIYHFFRTPKVTEPTKYIATAALTDFEKGTQNGTTHKISALLGDAQTGTLLMPLVYKENHSQFLRTRIESLIEDLYKAGQIDVVIFDNSPGDWGLGKAILEIVNEKELRTNSAVKINGKGVLVSSLDLNDIVSCILLREKEPKFPYLHIINRSPHGTDDISANLVKIVENLNEKGKYDPGCSAHASTLAQIKLDWVGVEDNEWKKIYQTHVKGIHVPTNIDALVKLLGWPEAQPQ